MPDSATLLPRRRSELIVRPLGAEHAYVVKDPRSGDYFHLGDEEHFLLTQLDGGQDAAAIRASFRQRFGQLLGEKDLEDFLEMARSSGLLQTDAAPQTKTQEGKEQ